MRRVGAVVIPGKLGGQPRIRPARAPRVICRKSVVCLSVVGRKRAHPLRSFFIKPFEISLSCKKVLDKVI